MKIHHYEASPMVIEFISKNPSPSKVPGTPWLLYSPGVVKFAAITDSGSARRTCSASQGAQGDARAAPAMVHGGDLDLGRGLVVKP